MRIKNKNKTLILLPEKVSTDQIPQQPNSYEGESLLYLLNSIKREIKLARLKDESLPHKIWLKQQFSIGVNDVTRVLERMPPVIGSVIATPQNATFCSRNSESPSLQLQAILIATDCNPRGLTKHLPVLASSREVPVIFVKDKKGGSFKLGEIVNMKTAMAIGVKVMLHPYFLCILTT
ncbi:50S ribosomal protein L30e-like protein [Artemisia annua]|uniref:50S ribosomal protein L30e-like protein n=1 Tax=Artemisia annua TaxID=35608 RepID=A0A2U1N6X1_ARTAN|nr:50S ribosomal protein L30e-like protein [Artemisia annua]